MAYALRRMVALAAPACRNPQLIPTVGKRQFSTTVLRRSSHEDGGYGGINLPFDIHNRWKLTIYFALFFGSGFALPYLTVRRQLLKKNR